MTAVTEGALPPTRDITAQPPGLAFRKFKDRAFIFWGVLATLIGLGTLVALVYDLVSDGAHRLSWSFFFSFPSSDPAIAGIYSAWVGSILVIIGMTLVFSTSAVSVALGITSAIVMMTDNVIIYVFFQLPIAVMLAYLRWGEGRDGTPL